MPGYGSGVYGTETYRETDGQVIPFPRPQASGRSRPPLELHVEIETPDGATVKLHAGAPEPGDRPQGMSCSTARYDGFKTGSFTLHRRIDRTWNDLRLFNIVRFISATGDVVFEGQIVGLPRSTGTPPTWTVQCAGLMANARDRKFQMVFVDRDISRWAPAPVTRQRVNATAGRAQGKVPVTVGAGGIVWTPPNDPLPLAERTEVMYDAGQGVEIARLEYRGTRTGTWTSFDAATFYTDDNPQLASTSTEAMTLDDTIRTVTAFDDGRYGMLRTNVSSAHTPAAGLEQSFDILAVYGNHGILIRDVADNTSGMYASDIIRWLIDTYCPLLNSSGVQDTTYPIGHLAFHDRTFPYDAMLTCNSFHRWGLECWEGGTVHFAPLDLTDYDWEIRLDDFGSTLDVAGENSEEVANGIEVTYTDASTGLATTLLPEDHDDLRDDSSRNPLNVAGRYRPTDITLSSPFAQADAIQIGRAALAEFNAPKHKGTATRQGYIKDRAGNDQPVSKVRAGDRVLITDSVDEEVHVVHETDYQHDRKEARLAIDDTFQRLDAYLDRYANALGASGLA
jgi:hypothetical protein